LSPALIDAARRWPPTKNSNEQRRGGAALKNKSTGAPGWRPLIINNPAADDYSKIACRIIKASSAHHMMTKGGLSPNYERTELIWPPATQEYQMALRNFQSNYCDCQSRCGFVPVIPNGHNNTRVNAECRPHFQGWK
jgi:hypothetical protein